MFWATIIGAALPIALLDRIALWLMVHVAPQGVHSFTNVLEVLLFVIFAIAVSISYITLINAIERKYHGRTINQPHYSSNPE
jgi:hypothetical protein